MALVNKSEAARLASISRTTLLKYIADGKLSATDGKIDTSELARVFGELKGEGVQQLDTDKTPAMPMNERTLLRDQIQILEGQIRDLKTDRDNWRDKASEAMDLLKGEQETIKLLTHDSKRTGLDVGQLLAAGLMVALLALVVWLVR